MHGSKSDAGVGFGVVFPDFNYCGALPSNASVFTSKLYGILTALKRIVHYENCSYTIFSYSKRVLEALGSLNPVHCKHRLFSSVGFLLMLIY